MLIEDGECIQTCKSIRIDINLYKQKYHIEPPKNINILPEEYLKLKKKFKKRALKELLEKCSTLYSSEESVKTFTTLYTVDGMRISSIEEIEDDC